MFYASSMIEETTGAIKLFAAALVNLELIDAFDRCYSESERME